MQNVSLSVERFMSLPIRGQRGRCVEYHSVSESTNHVVRMISLTYSESVWLLVSSCILLITVISTGLITGFTRLGDSGWNCLLIILLPDDVLTEFGQEVQNPKSE